MTSLQEIETLHSALGEAERYAKELEARLAEREWQPIETAPRALNQPILAFSKRSGVTVVSWSEYAGMWVGPGNVLLPQEIKLWMPLPEPPST